MKIRAKIVLLTFALPFVLGSLLGMFLAFSPHAHTGIVATKAGSLAYMAFPGGVEFSAHGKINSDRIIEASVSTYPLEGLYPRHSGLLKIVGTIPRLTIEDDEVHFEFPIWMLALIGATLFTATIIPKHRTKRGW